MTVVSSQPGLARVHPMPFGATPLPDGQVRFRLFAPAQRNVSVCIEGGPKLAMVPDGTGWHETISELARAGDRYRYLLADGSSVPDPASRFQPEDCHGPSEVTDPQAYVWADGDWTGRPWHEAVIYELHVGAFTPEGTFRSAIDKLDHLAALGITAIELMPVSDFSGPRNWGYDGVLPYAPDSSYGRPEDLKDFIVAAHRRRMMVLLDVVYNHFGPDGNALPKLVPSYVTERHRTPWGEGLNFDGKDSGFLREFFIHNALYWIEEFHFDGLRLDAVHAILDESSEHFLVELGRRVRETSGRRFVHLIAENEENQASLLDQDGTDAPSILTAQWNDDLHHVLHTAITHEGEGYYRDYLDDTEKLGRALAEGFVFQGEAMSYRGTPRGEASAHLPATAFVGFLQNHDQIGNRAFGDRITTLAAPEAVRAAAITSLLCPEIPLLFMGEEWGTEKPFPFFCGFEGDLAEAVRNGRREEFARFPAFQDPEARKRIPDPVAAETFLSAKLDWAERERSPHRTWLGWYGAVLSVRHAEIIPRLAGMRGGTGRFTRLGSAAVEVVWTLGDGSTLVLQANLAPEPLTVSLNAGDRTIWLEGSSTREGLGPWSVRWSIERATG